MPTDTRSTVGELARDLAWLEEHCRTEPDLAAHAACLRLASALARNVVGPFLEDQPAKPLHVAVVGGAGAGKSTVVNFLAGAAVAESNPQAGFTRHPTAFLPADAAFPWPSYLGFMGPLTRISEERPANLDEDVYQVRRIPSSSNGSNPLADFVIWDCPDMTTWASVGYVSRLMEVAALADVIVYVASDERYNDEAPTQFLHLLIRAGKAVVVMLTKMEVANAETLVGHFKQVILGGLPKLPDGATPAVPVIAFPQIPAQMRNDPAASPFRAQLVNQVLVQCEWDVAARQRTVANAAKYLATAGDGLLEVARRDLAEFEAWKTAVYSGKLAFEERYRREYLSGEQFRRFDRYRERLMELLELPGAARVAGNVLWVLRLPYRFIRDYAIGKFVRPDPFSLGEQNVLSSALSGWLDSLRAEALHRGGTHSLWKTIATGFDAGLGQQVRDRFQQDFRSFELKETDDLEKAGQEMVNSLERHPVFLGGLRIAKIAVDVIVLILVIYYTWPPSWYHFVLMLLAVSLTHQAAELLARAASEAARSRVRRQREALVSSTITEPLAKWLSEWPATGGSSFERLQQALRQIPALIKQLKERVNAKLGQRAPVS